jgi:hypothetical protein
MDIFVYGNAIVGSPLPTFFMFGIVLTISLILVFSLAQIFRWERALVAGSAFGLMATLTLALGGPQIMNIYYSALFIFCLIAGIWFTLTIKDQGG